MGENSGGGGGDLVRTVGRKHGRKRAREWQHRGVVRRGVGAMAVARSEEEDSPYRWAPTPPVGGTGGD
ncbi:hypothetical protein E2562_023237 [Oryza meyeriana var. granulata]|uniref:Uncharacterized protein n=1 Tax=Oryza meyeriana var. granulata TaxID=110450 RepID=A0A6G1DLH3_9ORYZ|nr:hypothetical protein E2562_023237 [Oryza meyeriana var. granulata]